MPTDDGQQTTACFVAVQAVFLSDAYFCKKIETKGSFDKKNGPDLFGAILLFDVYFLWHPDLNALEVFQLLDFLVHRIGHT